MGKSVGGHLPLRPPNQNVGGRVPSSPYNRRPWFCHKEYRACSRVKKYHASSFYPRDAMLARVLDIALCPCLCLCPSVTSRCSIETDRRSNLFLARRLLSSSPTQCFKEIQVSAKLRVLPAGTFFPKLRTWKISPRHIDGRACYQLSPRKVVAPSVINWTT